MKILILGGGQVGSTIAENLASDSNDITVVDQDPQILKLLSDRLDIQTLVGNAAHPSILEAAGAEDTDMLLAMTKDDETNLVACKLARHLFNVPTRIVRIRAADYMEYQDRNTLEFFDVEISICPEQIVTDNIYQLFEYPGALQVLDFAQGRAQLIAVHALEGGLLVGRPLREIAEDLPDAAAECRISAIYRNNALLIPDGDTVIAHGDEVFFIASRSFVKPMLRELRKTEKPIRRIMIAGGGNIGYRLSRRLEEDGYEVKLIEARAERCQWLSQNLSTTLVLHGQATDEELLEMENIDEMDVFISITNDDEDNIMSSLLAKRLGARAVISLVNRTSYVDLLQGDRIDIVISPHLSTIGALLTHIRRGDIQAVHPLRRGAAEAMEVIVHGSKRTSRVVGRRVDELPLPQGCYLSVIVRGEKVLMAHADLEIESEDRLIIFVSRRRLAQQIESILQVKIGFL